jgi:CO dehydrogenase/acetyl-CoA synthase beta subunit
MRAVCKNMACLERLKKQKKFLKSKGKDMVRCGLKTMDELEEAEEKERLKRETAAMLSNQVAATSAPTLRAEFDLFAGLKVLLLPPRVWAN